MPIPLNTIVLDLETAHSADDCRHCGRGEPVHTTWNYCPGLVDMVYAPIGWNDPWRLGLSIGCYFSYASGRTHFFDQPTLLETMKQFLLHNCWLVTFNGHQFDLPLMLACVDEPLTPDGEPATTLPAAWTGLAQRSYDLLAAIWAADPPRKFERGLNSLDAIAQANGLGAKLSHGAQAPRDWAAGRYADVLNYCADDVYKTKMLFEQIVEYGEILRGDGEPIALPAPAPETL